VSRSGTVIAAMALAAVALALGLHLGGGARLLAVEVSPDGRWQVEEYSPTRWQALFSRTREVPAVLRLVSRPDGERVGPDSPVVDLDDAGTPAWNAAGVSVGVVARFDRRAGRWRSLEALTRS